MQIELVAGLLREIDKRFCVDYPISKIQLHIMSTFLVLIDATGKSYMEYRCLILGSLSLDMVWQETKDFVPRPDQL